MAAAGRADVVAGDLQPLVIGGRGDHPLQQLAVARLALVLLAQLPLNRPDPLRQRVADRLQLAEVERPAGRRNRRDRGVDRHPPEALRDQPSELELQTPDLAAQLGPGESLVTVDAQRAGVSLDQMSHSPPAILPRFQGLKAIVPLRGYPVGVGVP